MKHLNRFSVFALLLAVFTLTANCQSNTEYKSISADELKVKINGSDAYTLLDVRTPREFQAGNIKGSINIAVQILPQELSKVLPDSKKDSEVIIYCRTKNRSRSAAKYMHSIGYTNIKVYLGGWSTWSTLRK